MTRKRRKRGTLLGPPGFTPPFLLLLRPLLVFGFLILVLLLILVLTLLLLFVLGLGAFLFGVLLLLSCSLLLFETSSLSVSI